MHASLFILLHKVSHTWSLFLNLNAEMYRIYGSILSTTIILFQNFFTIWVIRDNPYLLFLVSFHLFSIHICCSQAAYFLEQHYPWKVDSHSGDQEIPHLFWILMVPCLVHRSLSLDHSLNHFNPFNIYIYPVNPYDPLYCWHAAVLVSPKLSCIKSG